MSYFSEKKKIKETSKNETLAVATCDFRAEVIAKALNYYFGDTFTHNEAVEMMNQNTSNALKSIADYAKRTEMEVDELIDFMIDTSEQMSAQALLVSMRDELKFGKPIK